VDPVAFAPLLCAGIIGYRSFKMTNAPKNGRIALFGFGASAHIITQLMVKMGYGVIGISNSEQHVELARKLGASEAYASKESYKNIAKCDSAVVFAPVGELVLEALSILKPGGRAVIAGIHMSTIPPIDYDRLLFNERGIVSVEANTREDASEFLELAAKFGIKSAYNKMPFNRANEALQELKAGKVNGVNVLSGWT
jgi:propanol-preferring alcohol dehydrogenase